MNIEEVREYCLTLPYVTEDEFYPGIITFRIEGKWLFPLVTRRRKLMMWLDAPEPRVAVKCDPVLAIELRERYRGVEAAYHMNKKMWNDLYLERDLEEEEIRKWIRHSYDEVVRKSPYYKDGEFQNEDTTVLMTGKSSFWDMVTGRKKSKRLIPKEGEVQVIKNDLKHLPKDKDLYVWFGHSSFLLQLSGWTILVDPVFIAFSPVRIIGKVFPGTDIYKPEDMPDTIDYLIISHDHYDHLDHKTVVVLKDRVGKVICPLGVGENFEHWGYAKEQIIELDCNEDFADGFIFHCLPTRHFSGRSIKRNTTQRASWLIETPLRKVFYSGDGGYGVRFKRFGQQFPDIDLAIMENGQYDENWSSIHTMPGELGKEVSELHPNRFVTVHHSKVALANHAWDEPRENERKAAEVSGVPLITCCIGEIIVL